MRSLRVYPFPLRVNKSCAASVSIRVPSVAKKQKNHAPVPLFSLNMLTDNRLQGATLSENRAPTLPLPCPFMTPAVPYPALAMRPHQKYAIDFAPTRTTVWAYANGRLG